MKICVLGAGAVGGLLGTQLARSGCAVSAIARGATAAALRTHGFRLEKGGQLLAAPVRVADIALPPPPCSPARERKRVAPDGSRRRRGWFGIGGSGR